MSEPKWTNKDACELYHLYSKQFGKPQIYDGRKGGLALWTKPTKKVLGLPNCFAEHLLRDEKIVHLCPKKHIDFFYSYVKVNIPPERLADVLSLSGSVGYDPLKRLLYARCAGLKANIATLKLATDIALNHRVIVGFETKEMASLVTYKGVREIQKFGIYGRTIMDVRSSDSALKATYQELCKNIKELNKLYKMPSGYWEAAFSQNCGPVTKKIR